MNKRLEKFRIVCFSLGTVLPWLLLALGAILGLLTGPEWLDKASAYLASAGLLVMALSFFFIRLINWLDASHQ